MSARNFCHHCGKPVQADWKGCPHCQTSLGSLSATPPPPPPVVKAAGFAPFAATTDDEDDSYIDRLTHLNIRQTGLQLEIVKDRSNIETVGAAVIAGASVPPVQDTFKRGGVNPDTALADFQREASAMKPESRTHSVVTE